MSLIYDLTACGIKPDAGAPQTHAIQKVLDFCKENGGTVVFPKGTYRVSGLLLYSDTTVLLKSGAVLLGSENCDDYEVFDVPENVVRFDRLGLVPCAAVPEKLVIRLSEICVVEGTTGLV